MLCPLLYCIVCKLRDRRRNPEKRFQEIRKDGVTALNKRNVAEAFEKMLEGISQDVVEEEVLLLTEMLDELEDPASISEADLYSAAEQRANQIQYAYGLPQTRITMPPPPDEFEAPKRRPNMILIVIIAAAAALALIIGGVALFFHFKGASGDAAANENPVSEAAEEEDHDQEPKDSSDAAAVPEPTPAPAPTEAPQDTVNDQAAGDGQPEESPPADDVNAENEPAQDGQPGGSEEQGPGGGDDTGEAVTDETGAAPGQEDTGDTAVTEDSGENNMGSGEGEGMQE